MAIRQARQFRGVFAEILTGSATASIALIATQAAGTLAVTVSGVSPGDKVLGVFPRDATGAGVDVGNLIDASRVTAADTVTIRYENNTAGSITPPATTTYTVVVAKLELARYAD